MNENLLKPMSKEQTLAITVKALESAATETDTDSAIDHLVQAISMLAIEIYGESRVNEAINKLSK